LGRRRSRDRPLSLVARRIPKWLRAAIGWLPGNVVKLGPTFQAVKERVGSKFQIPNSKFEVRSSKFQFPIIRRGKQ
jgi:hypothetical protein